VVAAKRICLYYYYEGDLATLSSVLTILSII